MAKEADELAKKEYESLKAEANKANEALEEFIITLINSNISESSFTEVMEMLLAPDKVLKKKEDIVNKIADGIYKDIASKGHTDERKLDASKKATANYEKFKKWYTDREAKKNAVKALNV